MGLRAGHKHSFAADNAVKSTLGQDWFANDELLPGSSKRVLAGYNGRKKKTA